MGVYYLSKFRSLHNHDLETSFINAGLTGTDARERQVLSHFESDALDELLEFESRKVDTKGRHVLKVRN